jgi:uncharacterized protein YbjT (DUF2867 family)
MSSYTVRLDLRTLAQEDRARLLEALEYCRTHDKTGGFTYTITGDATYIDCTSREQAVRRGWYFKRRFGVRFAVIAEKPRQT